MPKQLGPPRLFFFSSLLTFSHNRAILSEADPSFIVICEVEGPRETPTNPNNPNLPAIYFSLRSCLCF